MTMRILDEDHNIMPFDFVMTLLKDDNGLNVPLFISAFRICVSSADIFASDWFLYEAWRYVDYAMDNYNLHDALMMTSPHYAETYVILCNMKHDL